MIKLSALFWLVMVSATGFAMFTVKYQVQSLADELARAVQRSDDTERDIRALDAEWAYLNRPDALASMNQRFLSLVPIATKQLRSGIAELPMRPVPPPSTPTETAVAGGTPVIPQVPPPALATASVATAASVTPAATTPQTLAANSPETPPADQPQPVVTVALDTPAPAVVAKPARVAVVTAAKPPAVKVAARLDQPRRARSLDELIAQVAESR